MLGNRELDCPVDRRSGDAGVQPRDHSHVGYAFKRNDNRDRCGTWGKGSGARSQAIDEDEINLKTAKKLQRLLEGAGAEVIMIREEDVDLAPADAKNVKREDLKRRVEIMNQPQVTLFVSIHCNISLDSRVHGAEVYYQQGNENSHQLAAAVLERLPAGDELQVSAQNRKYLHLETDDIAGNSGRDWIFIQRVRI